MYYFLIAQYIRQCVRVFFFAKKGAVMLMDASSGTTISSSASDLWWKLEWTTKWVGSHLDVRVGACESCHFAPEVTVTHVLDPWTGLLFVSSLCLRFHWSGCVKVRSLHSHVVEWHRLCCSRHGWVFVLQKTSVTWFAPFTSPYWITHRLGNHLRESVQWGLAFLGMHLW